MVESQQTGIDKSLWPETCHGRWMSEEYEPGLVSVIIPTYNRAHFLVEAMDSVWEQTYRPIELIVVDDGSTDSTQEVVEEWRKKRADEDQFELRYFHQENKGAPAARNLGLIESRGQYIQFLDSDDLLLPAKLQLSLQALSQVPYPDFVYGPWYLEKNGLRSLVVPPPLESCPRARTVAMDFLAICAGVYSRALARRAGPWNEELVCHNDWEYNVRVFLTGAVARFVDRAYSVVRRHDDGHLCLDMSRESMESRALSFRLVGEHLRSMELEDAVLEEELAERWLTLAKACLIEGMPRVARKILARSPFGNKRRLAWTTRRAGLCALSVLPVELLRQGYGVYATLKHRFPVLGRL